MDAEYIGKAHYGLCEQKCVRSLTMEDITKQKDQHFETAYLPSHRHQGAEACKGIETATCVAASGADANA